MLWLGLEEGVGHAETVVGAELQQALPVVIDLANSKVPKTGRPGVVVGTHPSIEVSQDDDMFLGGYVLHDVLMLM